jgi:Iap family predicted aminopeptidase
MRCNGLDQQARIARDNIKRARHHLRNWNTVIMPGLEALHVQVTKPLVPHNNSVAFKSQCTLRFEIKHSNTSKTRLESLAPPFCYA